MRKENDKHVTVQNIYSTVRPRVIQIQTVQI
jgi:hypothetical protein